MARRTAPFTPFTADQLREGLLAAIMAGRLDMLRKLLEYGADVAQPAPGHMTALMVASSEGQLECLRALLEAGADATQADAQGITALDLASCAGRLECVRALLEAGAGVAADGVNALIAASCEGQVECARLLLETGIDGAMAARNGQTALTIAIHEGQLECVRALLEGGADVAKADAHGWTPLMVAITEGRLDCTRALLEAGADVAQTMPCGVTALFAASVAGQLECVRVLLEAGANVLDDDGRSHALERACEHDSLELLQLLCAYAPSREVVRAHTMPDVVAIMPECARWLAATRRWTSPLHHFEFLPLERVRALLVEGADVHAGDGEAGAPTPISLATARLLELGDGADDGRAALIVRAGTPWSPKTHALFPASAKARAVELLHIGWLLAQRQQSLVAAADRHVEVAFRDAWLGHVMPYAIERASA